MFHTENLKKSQTRHALTPTRRHNVCGVHEQLSHLIAHVYGRVSSQQQRHYVHVAFLRCEVQRRDSLPRDRVGGGAVLQQRGGYLHLILLRCDVEGRVAVLGEDGEGFSRPFTKIVL